MSTIIYIVDTGAFIDYKHYYSRVRPFWDELLADLIKKNRMKSPLSVFEELQEHGEDDLVRFCKPRKANLFVDVHQQIGCEAFIAEQVGRYANNMPIASRGWQTDFDVIALARSLNAPQQQRALITGQAPTPHVISSEKPSGSSTLSTKIPDMCRDFGLIHIEPWRLAEQENFKVD